MIIQGEITPPFIAIDYAQSRDIVVGLVGVVFRLFPRMPCLGLTVKTRPGCAKNRKTVKPCSFGLLRVQCGWLIRTAGGLTCTKAKFPYLNSANYFECGWYCGWLTRTAGGYCFSEVSEIG